MGMNEIRDGMVVRLKSGGPSMTVSRFLDGGAVWCCWFDGNELKEASFMRESLAPVSAGA